MTVQIKARLSKDEGHLDGLEHARKELVDQPMRPRVVVAIVDVTKVTHSVLDGTDTPQVRVRQIEVLDGTDAAQAVDMLNRRYGARTGREDSQASLFDAVDDLDGPPASRLGEDDDPTLAERAAEAVEQLEARRAAGEQGGDGGPWPGDVEFRAPAGDEAGDNEAGDNEAATDEAATDEAAPKRGRGRRG